MKVLPLILNTLVLIFLTLRFLWFQLLYILTNQKNLYIFLFNFKHEQLIELVFSVFEIDSVQNSRAVSVDENEVTTPDQISAMFDKITYYKVIHDKKIFYYICKY
jgi:hypothetical protein